jgi:hypothetical protein
MPSEAKPMTPTDVLLGYPYGHVAPAVRFRPGPLPAPRRAIEDVVLRAVTRPPCVVAFSGGRDSSAILALAVHVARREGLPEPIPVTRTFSAVPESQEREWQELVLQHLAVSDWVRETIDDEMDVIGPLAQARLRNHGVRWSPLLHGDDFFLRHAQGGSILDGEGGDDVCDPRGHRGAPVARLLRLRRRPNRWQLRAAAGALAPGALRGRHIAKNRGAQMYPWLRGGAIDLLRDAIRDAVATEPLEARSSIMLFLEERSVVELQANRQFFAQQQGALFLSPLLDPGFAASLATHAGRLGFRNRAEGLRVFCADLLPDAILDRTTKAEFNATFFNRYSHEFADRWSGAGIDPELADHDVLRATWRGPDHNALSAALLQAAWLADERA